MFQIYVAELRDVTSWNSSPILRQEYFSDQDEAILVAMGWSGWSKEVTIDGHGEKNVRTINVKEPDDE